MFVQSFICALKHLVLLRSASLHSTSSHSASLRRVSGRKLSYAILASNVFFLLALILFSSFVPSRSFADEPITVNPSITIGNSGVLSLDVNPGQFGSSTESVVVTTSNYTGYSMTIAPSSGNNTDLEHTNVANTVIPSIPESLTQSSFSSLNSVAYGLSIDDGANYLPVVSGSTIKTTSTATNATTGSFNLTLGAKTLANTPAGSYTKTFLLTATTNDAAYNITYDKNLGGDTDTTGNFPSSNEATVSGTVLTLSAKTPTRTGYEFLHWNTVDDDSGTSYNVQGTINLEPTTANPITLYAIWGCGSGYICYHENGADGGQGTMKHTTFQSSAYSAGSTQTLIAPNFSKTGYGFVGWSETPINPTQSTANIKSQIATLAGQNKIYGPNQNITIPSPIEPVNLYAVWLPAEKDGNDDPVYLQGWNGCSSLAPNGVIALTDNRDNEVYTIARIVDDETNPTYSQCWMIENLRLDVANQNITYTNANTNHPASSFLAQKDVFAGETWKECAENSVTCINQISYSLANTVRTNSPSHNTNNQTSSWYSYGNMYNSFTATAGNGLYGYVGNDTVGDICPNGWRLPTSKNSSSDIVVLDTTLGGTGDSQSTVESSNRWRTFPLNLIYSGLISDSITLHRGGGGMYWTSTQYLSGSAYNHSMYSSILQPTHFDWRYVGFAVRCLSGNPNYYIVYNANGGTGYGDPQSLGTTAPDGTTTTTLIASNFKRTGYGFAGWSRNPNADPNGVNATTEIYGPNAEYTVPAASNFDSNKNLTLYAIWVPLAKDSNNNDLTFQTTNLLTVTLSDNSTLDSKAIGYVTALKDTRDNEVYAVAKLADGNYWMIENMRLDLSSSSTTITTSNTNHPTAAFVTDINDNYKGKADDPNTTLWKTCQDSTPACIDQTSFAINNLNRESVTPITTNPTYNYQDYGWRSYGVYYNFYTATGGTGTISKIDGTTDGDICPAGWHLPQGGSSTGTRGGNTSGGFYYLARKIHGSTNFNNATGSANLRKYPNNYIRSGTYYGSSTNRRNTGGNYWSSTIYSYNIYNGYNTSFSNSAVNSGTNDTSRYYGFTVRCIINTLESFTLTYNVNGGTGAPASDPGGSSNTRSYDFTISSTTPTRSGLSFAGWSTDQNATEESILYQAGSTFTAYQPSTTLYAVWVPEVIIHFDGSGGTGIMADQGVPSGTSRTLRSNTFRKSGYSFVGWTTTEGSTNVEYTDGASYTAPVVTGPDPLEVTLHAVWGRSRSIMYNINTDDVNANGTMDNQTGIYEYQPAELWASNFARPNYGFAGWSTDSDAYTHMTDNDQTNDPTIYGPNETIVVPGYGEGSKTLTLYAVWVPAESGVTMQTFNPNDSTYSSKPIGSVIALNDNRDTTNVYAVAKLKDGNWWMIENLRFDPAGKTLDNTNTNNPDSSFATTVSGLQSSSFATCEISSAACDDQYSVGLGNITASDNNRSRAGYSQSYRWYSYGAMYNWYTATAGHGVYSKTKADGAMPGDICPAGWHLPYGGNGSGTKGGNTSGGFYYLNYKLNNDSNTTDATASNGLRAYPNNLVYTGFYTGSSTAGRGNSSSNWSSTANGGFDAYSFGLTSTHVSTGAGASNRYYGFAVRCVASPRQTLTLSFDTTKVASVEIDGTSYSTNGATISLAEGSTHTINMTFQTGYDFDSWSISGTGSSVASTSTNPTTLTMGTASATLTATANGYLQGWNGCDNMSVGDTVTLYDRRDNQAYTVSKYSMGNNTAACWMSNLNLGAETLAVAELNNTNSNMPTATPISKTTFESWIVSTGTASYTNPELIPLTAANTSNGLGEDSYGNKYGTSYNYAAATANTINAPINENMSDATNSLCPSGWRLPSGYGSSEFMQLMIGNGGLSTEMNSTTTPTGAEMSVIAQRDLGFSFAGRFYTSTPASQGTYGRYWSSTRSTNEPLGQPQKYSSMVTLRVDATYVRPGIDTTRLNGASIRCIKQRPMHTITLSLDSGVDSLIIDGVSYENGDTVTLEEGTSHEVDIDFVYGYGFDSWSATSGTIMTPSSYPSAYTVGASNATFTVATKDITGSFLQTWNGCSSLATDSSITLYDSRDSQAYTVSKYKMNSNGTATACWMSNLNLGAEPLTVSTLNGTNSNMPTASAISESTFKSWEIPKNTYGSYEDAQYNVRNGVDSYGNRYATRYNYAAISANTINAAEEANNSDATNSLCPYGWRLPTGGSSGEFAQLMTGYGGLTTSMNSSTTPTSASMFSTLTSTLGFPDSLGFVSNPSSITNLGNSAYWASTRVNGSSMDHLAMSTSYVGPNSSAGRTWVISARCIKQ